MVVLSARFAALASLCAVIAVAIPPRVEAAHIYAGNSMEKHAFQRPRSASFSGRSATTHGHDGKNTGHYPPDHHYSGLPPLLRRSRGRARGDKHLERQSQDSQDKVVRSAFARSRYRRGPVPQSRRSSVYISGEHGNTYLVSGTPPRKSGQGHRRSSRAHDRRQLDESDLALGRIDIMSPASAQRLASLIVDSTPIDWTSGQTTSKAFPLNASMTNQTQFIMMPTDANAGGSFNKHVTLATEVFDAGSAEMVMFCATYDPDPGATSALLMTPCTSKSKSAPINDAGDPCVGNVGDASNPHQSQIFSYDPSSGKIEPISDIASTLNAEEDSDDSGSCGGTRKVRRDGNSTTSASATSSSTSTSMAPTASGLGQAKNVTLVYVAGAIEVPAASPSPGVSSTVNPNEGHAAVVTTTITTTVLATATGSGSSSRIGTPAQAAVSVSTSSTPSQSATASTTSTSMTLSSGAPAPTNSNVPANADESFEVEVVGLTPSTTSAPSTATSTTRTTSSTTTTSPTTTTSFSSTSATPTRDALAVASSIVNEFMSHPVVAKASASVLREV